MLRALLVLAAATAESSCQQYEHMKARWLPQEQPWTKVAPPPGPPVDAMAGPCTIPIHEDEYYGFQVGRPHGWQLDYSTGTLIVSPDARQLVGALIFPARLHRTDLSADQLASEFSARLGALVRRNGGSLELTDKVSDGRVARATAVATLAGVPVRGSLQVIETNGFATIKLYWAPAAELAADEPTLRQVVGCFKRETLVTRRRPIAPAGGPVTRVGVTAPADGAGTSAEGPVQPLQAYRGRYVAMRWPAGWSVTNETDHGVDLLAQNHSAALSWTWLSGTPLRADVAAMRALQRYPTAHVTSQAWEPAPHGWQVAVVEFAGPVNSIAIHGYSRVAVGNGVTLDQLWVVNDRLWTQLRPTLAAMASSVQIQPAAIAQVRGEIRQQLASYPPIRPSTAGSTTTAASSGVMGKWANDDRKSQEIGDTMLQQDRARSPTTGEDYVVPTSAWSETGPQGPGYYRAVPGGGTERLDVQGTDYQ